jgi:LPPG:FO 2-phospho-L-lactate transferase
VNTGDDFEWLGLYICPDLDTVIYTLAGIANPETGWGVANDTFNALDRLKDLGLHTWFKLGDRDLATHIYRTHFLSMECSLSQVTRSLCELNGLGPHILPMTDMQVPTRIQTEHGLLDFQDYFVRRKCAPRVEGFVFEGIEQAKPAPGVLEAIASAEAVVICPSNPFISIGPILAVPGIRAALRTCVAPVAAVSPIIAGQAVKGPTATMLAQLRMEVSAWSVAALYRDLLDIFVLDERDRDLLGRISSLGVEVITAPTLMHSPESSATLASCLVRKLEESVSHRTSALSRPNGKQATEG